MQSYSHIELVFKEILIIQSATSNKRKYTPMKEALIQFQSYLEHNRKFNPLSIPREEILKLLKPASNIIGAKFHIALIGFLLQMTNIKAVNHILIYEDILTYFLIIKDIQKDVLQVKLQQSFMNLLNQEFVNFANFTFVEKCFTMVLFMRNSRQPIISSSADQTLSKMIELLSLSTQLIIANNDSNFDSMELQIDLSKSTTLPQKQEINSLSPMKKKNNDQELQIQNLAKLLQDFLLIADFKKPTWYPQNISMDREFGLSSINSFLQNMGKFFLKYAEIETILKINLFGIIKKLLLTPQSYIKSSIVIECFKCLVSLIDIFQVDFLDLWELIFSYIKTNEHSVYKNLSFQALLYSVQNSVFLGCLVKSHASQFFLDFMAILPNISKDTPQPNEIEMKRWQEFMNPIRNIQSPSSEEVLPSDPSLVLRMLSEFQMRFSNSLSVYAEQSNIRLGKRNKPSQNGLFYLIMDSTWKHNFRCIKHILTKELEEEVIQNSLLATQNYVNIMGSIGYKIPQDTFVKMICEYCLPKQGQKDFTKRHIQINKMVLNIGNCLGNLLECSCWIHILKTFQECENFYLHNRLAKDSSQEEQLKTQDISILFNCLDQLFTNSTHYDNEHLLVIMDAVNQITIDCLESNQIEMQRKFGDQKVKLFSLSKLIELIKANLYRLDLFWEVIMAHFICVLSSKNTVIIQNATESLSSIIFMAFEFLCAFYKKSLNHKAATNFIKEKWSIENYQFTIFQPWVDLCALKSSEVKEIILVSAMKLLQNNGHELGKRGWDQVLAVLNDISTTLHVKQGLNCTEYIINHFLGNIDSDHIQLLFDAIENFKANSSEQNINFQICNMVWHIGDFIIKTNKCDQESLLIKIFNKLSAISMDNVTEIRHSAIHIFTSIMMHMPLNYHHSILSSSVSFWKSILDNIFFEMMNKLALTFQEKSQGNEQDVLQWEETAKSFFLNSIKIIKKYFSLLDKEENSQKEIQSAINQFIPQLITVMKQNKGEILLEGAKIMKELFIAKPSEHFNEEGQFLELLEFLEKLFTSPPQDTKLLKTIIIKVIPEVIDFLSEALQWSIKIKNMGQIQLQLFANYEKILQFPLVSDMTFNLVQNKIFYEDTYALNIIANISKLIPEANDEFIQYLVNVSQKILSINPTNKSSSSLLRKFSNQEYKLVLENIKIEKVTFALLSQFSKTVKSQRSNKSIQKFDDEDKSIWAQISDYIHEIIMEAFQQGYPRKQLIKQLQDMLPSQMHFAGLLDDYQQSTLKENIALMNKYLDLLSTKYVEQIEQDEEELFKQFLQICLELTKIEDDGEIALQPVVVLSKLSSIEMPNANAAQQVLQCYLSISENILTQFAKRDQKANKLVIKVLETLNETKIPKNMLNHLNPIFKSQNGHLAKLMPHLCKCISCSDHNVRVIVQQLMEKIAQEIQN